MNTVLRAAALALLVALAGCTGGIGGTDGPAPAGTSTADMNATATVNVDSTTGDGRDGGGRDAGDGGATDAERTDGVNLYLSDERNAIDDFRHLNVTISRIGFEAAEGGWTEFEIPGRTADLTALQGANATRIATLTPPNGTYRKVFVYVEEVNATLESGEHVRVKLPSEKLHVEKGFTLGANASVDFVFDITVHRAGNSGKYVLQPVVAESGTDAPIESVDRRDGEERNRSDADERATLSATFAGNVTPGANATVEVTRNGSAVANASVTVDGERVGATGVDGHLTFAVPDAPEVRVGVIADGAETELELEFEDDGRRGE